MRLSFSAGRYRRAIQMLPLTALVLFGLGSVYGSNIVMDGGFESAASGAAAGTEYFNSGSSIDGGSWIVAQGTVGVDTQNFYLFDGNKSVFLDGNKAGPDSLQQSLSTVAGQTYMVDFWANADVANTFLATFGGSPITGAPTSIAQNGFPSGNTLGNSNLFTMYSGTATATSDKTDLVFTATGFPIKNGGVTVEMDDVSVSPLAATPEPSSLAYTVFAALAIGFFGLRRRSSRAA